MGDHELTRIDEMQKKMREHRNDIEFALMRGSSASGSSSTARRLDRIEETMRPFKYKTESWNCQV